MMVVNAANAEESASASEELNAQAESMNDVVGELVTLVGGSSTRSSRSSGSQRFSAKTNNFGSSGGLKKSDQTFHKIANGKSQPKKQQKKQSAAPEKVIPLKGDDKSGGSDDFSEFNG